MKREDFRAGKRYIHKDAGIWEFVEGESDILGFFKNDEEGFVCNYTCFTSSVSDAKSMSNYKEGDIVVMNVDVPPFCYIDEKLTYFKPSTSGLAYSILKNIHGDTVAVPNGSFDLRDPVAPVFEVGKLIEVSDNPVFNRSKSGYFICDARNVNGFSGGCPFVVVSTITGSVLSYSYARKPQTYTIKYDCIEYTATKEQYERHLALIAELKL